MYSKHHSNLIQSKRLTISSSATSASEIDDELHSILSVEPTVNVYRFKLF